MKIRFNTYDIICGVTELQKLVGMRVNQVYDIDNKTYLIRLQQSEEKHVLLLDSGIRFHTTSFEWPKNVAPSGFTMKLRKHLKNKRLEKLEQLGVDRIVKLQFGTSEAAYHVILELYDKGNIILTDHELTILNVLRPHVEGEEVRFAVREKYPTNRAKQCEGRMSEEALKIILNSAAPGDNLRKILTPVLDCGPTIVEHILHKQNLAGSCIATPAATEDGSNAEQPKAGNNKKQRKKGGDFYKSQPFDMEKDLPQLIAALEEAEEIMEKARTTQPKGYIIIKKEGKPTLDGAQEEFYSRNVEYHPLLFAQHEGRPYKEFDSFMAAVDEYYSTIESQKIDMKAMSKEREALKKLQNVKKDHAKRLENLTKAQESDKQKAELITRNQELVDNIILVMRSIIASQASWPEIEALVKRAQSNNDALALAIKQLKFQINHVCVTLKDPYREYDNEYEEDEQSEDNLPTMDVDIDLDLSAFANARRYYDQKRYAAQKEQRTIDASEKAMKSAEKKTQQTLKEVRTLSTISKARKVYWFEKFYWFISSENYLVIGGRDGQQNELIVKRYMRPTDIYVHAEIQGASSVVIRNPTGGEVPPKTLLEAGTMAISYSVAWDAKVVTNAYWVKSEQVSKTAPTGEYLSTGSFMIRGKKNFLPPCHLIMGMSMLYKLEDSSVERHKGERRVRTFDDEATTEKLKQLEIENEKLDTVHEEEIVIDDADDSDDAEPEPEMSETVDNEENHSTSDESSDGDVAKFPDTQIKIEHDTGKVILKTSKQVEDLQSPKEEKTVTFKTPEVEEDAPFIIAAPPTRIKQMSSAKKKKEARNKKEELKQQQQQKIQEDTRSSLAKRGQRGKLKKIKAKYRDQDEEERQMRMEILKSAGKDKITQSTVSTDEDGGPTRKTTMKPHERRRPQEDTEDLDEVPANADVEMLESLTGLPLDEDEILFAIPVVAPYQALHNYKHKVKLTPGTGKRGKAAKTAILMFTKDKTCSSREKDLLKSVKEETLARNIPGKVKLSAPQLQKYKK